ncbi:S41 family peptidase [Arcicella sp. LKC2W]|uniref:S41 family peptidase n=1 Tax=Arcicella sp. LKC2W TaxID=2984198 RepID=UPI002B1EAAE5|nr:S41 family peptidase [Arcicella sp. LKC2W]MEA5460037.1 S41 family peptidase [Arcicella sp. LKC2W]
MKKKLYLLLFFLFQQQTISAQKLSVEQINQDFDFLQRILEEAHPSLYWYTPKTEMDSAFKATKLLLNRPLNERELYNIFSPLIAKIHCGHTYLNYSQAFEIAQQPIWLPMQLKYINDKLLIVNLSKSCSDSTLTKGTEIIAIDSIPVAKMVEMVRMNLFADGFNQTFKDYFIGLYRFEEALMYHFGKKEPYRFTVKDTFENIRESVVFTKKRASPEPIKPEKKLTKDEEKIAKAKDLGSMRNYEILKKENALLMTCNGFGYEDYKVFNRKVFTKIKQKKIKNLIIDLRNNSGGDVGISDDILKYILKKPIPNFLTCDAPVGKLSFTKDIEPAPKDHLFNPKQLKQLKNGKYRRVVDGISLLTPYKNLHFSGNIYVLTSGLTFSAGAILASLLKAHSNAIFIGQETGGGEAGCSGGLISKVILPQSNMKLKFPHFHLEVNTKATNIGRGVMPNFPINYTPKDIAQNRDLELETVSTLITNHK